MRFPGTSTAAVGQPLSSLPCFAAFSPLTPNKSTNPLQLLCAVHPPAPYIFALKKMKGEAACSFGCILPSPSGFSLSLLQCTKCQFLSHHISRSGVIEKKGVNLFSSRKYLPRSRSFPIIHSSVGRRRKEEKKELVQDFFLAYL